jgi:hypothetical protein
VHQLTLQTSPETLHRCVVIAIALARHRGLHAKLYEQPPIAVRAILGCRGPSDGSSLLVVACFDMSAACADAPPGSPAAVALLRDSDPAATVATRSIHCVTPPTPDTSS